MLPDLGYQHGRGKFFRHLRSRSHDCCCAAGRCDLEMGIDTLMRHVCSFGNRFFRFPKQEIEEDDVRRDCKGASPFPATRRSFRGLCISTGEARRDEHVVMNMGPSFETQRRSIMKTGRQSDQQRRLLITTSPIPNIVNEAERE